MPQNTDLLLQSTTLHYLSYGKLLPPPTLIENSVVNALNREGKKKILTEFGEMLPGCRPMQAKVFASSAEFTPQFGATFAWHRMWTFILQTDRGNGKEKQRTIKITWRGLLLRFNLLILLQKIHPSGSTLE